MTLALILERGEVVIAALLAIRPIRIDVETTTLALFLIAKRLAPGIRESIRTTFNVRLVAAREPLDPGILGIWDLALVLVLVLDRGVLRRIDQLAGRVDAGILEILVDVRRCDSVGGRVAGRLLGCLGAGGRRYVRGDSGPPSRPSR